MPIIVPNITCETDKSKVSNFLTEDRQSSTKKMENTEHQNEVQLLQ